MVERTLTVRVARIRRETPEILSFELAHPWGRELPGFEAGAHIDVRMPGGFARQYSLARAPGVDGAAGRYLIGVKREGASRGGSASMHERVSEGDLLPISAPRNTFPVQAGGRRHLLLAGGIGMTPLLAMAQSLAAKGLQFELCVFARSREHLAFADALAAPELAPHVRLHLDAGEAGEKIDVQALLREHAEGTHLYMCGPAGFMNAVRKAAAHWPESAVHAEYFAAPGDSSVPAGKAFSLRLTRRSFSVPVAADQTAVDALHDFGIDIPVSCEQGLCGTCVVPAEGEGAEHRDFCLTSAERQQKVALCCSRAREQELVIHL